MTHRFLVEHEEAWKYAEVISIKNAGLLLTGHDPARYGYNNRALPSDAEAIMEALRQAVVLRRLEPFAAWAYVEGDRDARAIAPVDIGPHTYIADQTTLLVSSLARWCKAKGIEHLWESSGGATDMLQTHAIDYPEELRAAIEAFLAVHRDTAATMRKTPKAALLAWLETNKPALSVNARERIATVANWQPSGGAPKTPGG
jgi:hypothetical protein